MKVWSKVETDWHFRTLFVLLWLALSSSLVAQELKENDRAKVLPRSVAGRIVNLEGDAIAGATVQISLISWDSVTDVRKEHFSKELEADKEGRFSTDMQVDRAARSNYFLYIHAYSKYHFRRMVNLQGDELYKEELNVGDFKLARGVRLKGRVVGSDGSKVVEPTASFWADDVIKSSIGEDYFYREISCDEDGSFEHLVPNKCDLTLEVGGLNFAMKDVKHKVEAAVDSDGATLPIVDLGTIKLPRGVVVVGKAKLLDGSPAAGAVVVIAEDDGKENAKHVSAVKVDSEGEFRLPPHQGKCLILVTEGRSRKMVNGERVFLRSSLPNRFFEQLEIDLEGKGPQHQIQLKEIESIEVSGTVVDRKGAPVPDVMVSYGWYCRLGPVSTRRVATDKNGRYKFPMGKGIRPEIQIFRVGERTPFLTADTVEDYADLLSNESFGRLEDPEFEPLSRNVPHLNWQLVEPESGPSSVINRAGEAIGSWLLGG